MPDRALYYPHTSIYDPKCLFDSLLYWDNVSCIVPYERYKPDWSGWDKETSYAMQEAAEHFTCNIVPTGAQKLRAHEMLRDTLLQHSARDAQGTKSSDLVDFYTMKASALTLEVLLIGVWFDGTVVNIREIHDYVERSKAGKEEHHPDYAVPLPRGIVNLILAALAAACSSENMPPVTSDYYSFVKAINAVLPDSTTGTPKPIDYEFKPEDREAKTLDILQLSCADRKRSDDLRALFATIPCLGSSSPSWPGPSPADFRKLVLARRTAEVRGRQKAFRDEVDKYLKQLQTATVQERLLIIREFQEAFSRDLGLLAGELSRLGLLTLIAKEGLVGMGLGAVSGTPAGPAGNAIGAGIGAILGLSQGLLKYPDERQKVMKNHWASWVLAVERINFSIC